MGKLYHQFKEAILPLVRKINKNYLIIIPIDVKNINQAIQLNGFSIQKSNSPTIKKYHFNPESPKKFKEEGGIIIFSSHNKLVSEINIIQLEWNQIIDTNLNLNIGNFVKGRYKDGDNNLYDKNSIGIEITSITSDDLHQVAQKLSIQFNQKSILVKNYQTNKTYLVKNSK
jgi:hypothetical protein